MVPRSRPRQDSDALRAAAAPPDPPTPFGGADDPEVRAWSRVGRIAAGVSAAQEPARGGSGRGVVRGRRAAGPRRRPHRTAPRLRPHRAARDGEGPGAGREPAGSRRAGLAETGEWSPAGDSIPGQLRCRETAHARTRRRTGTRTHARTHARTSCFMEKAHQRQVRSQTDRFAAAEAVPQAPRSGTVSPPAARQTRPAEVRKAARSATEHATAPGSDHAHDSRRLRWR